MNKKTSGPMVNKMRKVAKGVVVCRGWQALTLWKMVFLAMLQARRVGKTQPAMWQLTQPPVKMGQLIHPPMKMEQLTLPQETRPNKTSRDQKICLVPDLCLGDLGMTWLWCNSIVALLLCLCFFQEPRDVSCDCCPCRMLSPPSCYASSPGRRSPSESLANQSGPASDPPFLARHVWVSARLVDRNRHSPF